MAADADRYARVSALLRCNLAGLVVCVGILSVVQDSSLGLLPHRGNLHVLFGALLWLCIVERFYARLRLAPRMSLADIRPLSRQLSRLVYLLLYVLISVRLVIDLCAAPHRALSSRGDFHSYLVCGVLAIIAIQALAALCHHLLLNGAAASTLNLVPPDALLPGETLVQRNGRLT